MPSASGFTSVRTDKDFEELLDDLRITVRPILSRGELMRRCTEIVAARPGLLKEVKTDGKKPPKTTR